MDDDLQSAAYYENSKPKVYAYADNMETLAYHESGHAILSRLINKSFQMIVIGDGGGYVGGGDEDVTSYYNRVKSGEESFLKAKPIGFQGELLKPLAARKICGYLAGLQAEMLLAGERLDGEVYRDGFDHNNARQLCEEAFGHSNLQYFQGVTRDYLSRCWAETQRTANELLVRYDRYGFAAIRSSNANDSSFFARDNLPAKWIDEDWS